jgi:hypothetical protein
MLKLFLISSHTQNKKTIIVAKIFLIHLKKNSCLHMILYSSMNYLFRKQNSYSKYTNIQKSKPGKFYRIVWCVHIGIGSTMPWVCAIIVIMRLVAVIELQLVHILISQITLCNDACNVISALNY